MFKDKKLLRFIITCLIVYLFWFLVYDLWLKPDGRIDNWLTHMVSEHAVAGLRLFGIPAYHAMDGVKHLIRSPESRILIISNACNGLVLYPLFIGFILAIPGKLRSMGYMIAAGCVLIYLTNVLRATVLCLIKINAPQYLDFNHRFTFAILVYAVIFLLWVLWVNRYADLKLS